jgi:serine/threonine-protein kinase
VWNTDQGVAMTFAAIAAAQLPVPSRMRPDLPPSFDTWFKKALERDPNARFQSAKELADALAQALDTAPISLVSVAGATSQIELEAIAGLREVQSDPGQTRTAPGGTPPGNQASEPLDLAKLQTGMSATDLSATETPETSKSSAPPRRSSAGRVFALLVVLGGAVAGGWFGYVKVLRPRVAAARSQPAINLVPPSASVVEPPPPPAPPEVPKWVAALEEGQLALSTGDADGAMRKFKDSGDLGGGPVAKTFQDQVKLGAATTGPCKMMALSQPRLGYASNAGRPTVAATSKGAIVAWTDDHEQAGHDHVYSVLIDAAGRPTSSARDLTPEADNAMRPALLTVDDRVLLLFWDKGGREPGVKVRWLDADGRIGGMSVAVGASKTGLFWPAIDRSLDGSGFWVTWQENAGQDTEDLFLRHLDAELAPSGPAARVTSYAAEKGKAPQVGSPSVAIASQNLFLAYALERDHQHFVERMRVPLAMPELTSGGLSDKAAAKGPRELGDTAVVNEDKVGGDYPSMVCGKDACFLVWHETDKGAEAALVDPVRGTVLWRKRFTIKGGHPAVAISPEGLAELAFYEAGRVRIAGISRDGVGTTSTFAKVTGDQPRPWIAPGRTRGEWFVSWLDLEASHTEAFVTRLQCRN